MILAPAAPSPPIGLRAAALVVLRSDRLVLDGINLQLAPGEALLLTGPNGAGKSTLLRAIAGLCPLAAGRIEWDGADISDDLSRHAARLAYLGHQDALKPGLTVRENLRLTARLGGGDPLAALGAYGLSDLADLPVRLLSAGQRRRAALARVLLEAVPLWLLDEPSLGLDDAALDRLGTVLASHRAHGGMVIATTHVGLPMPEVRHLALGA
ncbi:heme ABC exporter ATP-binding protein CcmA [Lichenicola sp.]|uniref:heme ABC exporter ATP-binding protein CcmA n=1 Tax=Lichenicola sp. TaxID=2804529 RepID=UPI003AFFD7D3